MYVLFVTRTFPPSIGGMEKYSYDLYNNLKKNTNVDLLANKKGKKFLIPFLFFTVFYIFINRKKYTNVHIGDGVLAPVGAIAKLLTNAKISITIHALDIVYDKYFYQSIIPPLVSKVDKIVCVSQYTLNQCVARKIDKKKCLLIPNGIDFDDKRSSNYSRKELQEKLGIKLENKELLLSVCRLVERKGLVWFVNEVITNLSEHYVYVIVGTGPEKSNLLKTIVKHKLQDKVIVLQNISEQEKIELINHSSFLIMPNIYVKGNAEGFGISIIEAGAYGLPSVASNIDGIPDAVVDGITGKLVEPMDKIGFIDVINHMKFDEVQIMETIKNKYNWSIIIKRYIDLFSRT